MPMNATDPVWDAMDGGVGFITERLKFRFRSSPVSLVVVATLTREGLA